MKIWISLPAERSRPDWRNQRHSVLARRGLGIAFTYRSCIEESRDVVYLSIGKKRCFVNLALIYPQEGYRSRAVRAFENAICRVMATEVF